MPLQRLASTHGDNREATHAEDPTPGKETQVEQIAAKGVAGPGGPLPFGDQIVDFGAEHAGTVGGIRAHTGDAATAASADIGAQAYATGNDVAFGGAPDLHTAAHEAAHVVQQKQGVSLKGGVGAAGDQYEQHADAVADRVVNGLSAASLLGDAGSASSGPAVQRKGPTDDWSPTRPPAKGAPKDDWQVTHDDPQHYTPSISMDPDVNQAQVFLGGEHKQRFYVEKPPPAGTTLHWSPDVRGAQRIRDASPDTGNSTTVRVMPTQVGESTLSASVTQSAHGNTTMKRSPLVTLTTPAPVAEVTDMWSDSPRGRIPVMEVMQVGEELLVSVRLHNVDDSVKQATATFAGPMDVKETIGVGGGHFQVRLKPRAVGKGSGMLALSPAHTTGGVAAPVNVKVEKQADVDDFGSRPKDADDAAHRVVTSMAEVYHNRNTGVDKLLKQLAEKDPPPKTPLWKQLIAGAAKIALSAATGGLGVAFASHLMEHIGSESEPWKEFFKMSAEGLMDTLAEAGAEKVFSKDEGGEKTGIGAFFLGAQHEALAAEEKAVTDKAYTSAKAKAERLEKEKAGSGYRSAVNAAAAIEATAKESAHHQYVASFEAWCTLLAQNSLTTTNDEALKEKSEHPEKAEAQGTNLASQMDINNVVRHEESQPDPLLTSKHMVPAKGLAKTPGVLRVEFAEVGSFPQMEQSLYIKEAFIQGLDNDDVAETVKSIPFKDLKMPVVGRFNVDREHGFVIGRNEVGAYFGEFTGGLTTQIIPGGDPVAAARRVFERDIHLAERPVAAKRG